MKGAGLTGKSWWSIVIILILGMVFTVASCNSSSTTPTAGGTTTSGQGTTITSPPQASASATISPPASSVQSSDGTLTLDIPAGALPSGVDLSSITITKLTKDDPASPTVDNQAPLAYYRLEPDGLEFAVPTIFKVTLPFSGTTIPMPFLLSPTSGLSLPDSISVKLDTARGTVDISGEISHFSGLGIALEGPFTISINNPGNQLVGSTFMVSGLLAGSNMPFTVKQKDDNGAVTTYNYALKDFEYSYRFRETGTESHISPDSSGINAPVSITEGQQPDSLSAEFTALSPYSMAELTMDLTIILNAAIWSSSGEKPVTQIVSFLPELYCNFSIVKPWSSGTFQLITAVDQDPAGHAHVIMLSPTITAQVDVQGDPTITISGNGNWVMVSGEINPDGSFTATGIGTVAGQSDVNVIFEGIWTEENGFSGTYTMGAAGELPTGQSITYTVTAARM